MLTPPLPFNHMWLDWPPVDFIHYRHTIFLFRALLSLYLFCRVSSVLKKPIDFVEISQAGVPIYNCIIPIVVIKTFINVCTTFYEELYIFPLVAQEGDMS